MCFHKIYPHSWALSAALHHTENNKLANTHMRIYILTQYNLCVYLKLYMYKNNVSILVNTERNLYHVTEKHSTSEMRAVVLMARVFAFIKPCAL